MKKLTFTQEDGFYVAEVETNGEPIAVQVNRKYFPYPHDYSLEVLGRIDPSMPWSPVQMFDYKSPRNIIVYQNIPVDGCQLKLRSRTEVESAGYLRAESTAQIVIPTEEQIGFENPSVDGGFIELLAIYANAVSPDLVKMYIDDSETEIMEVEFIEITTDLAEEIPFLANYVGQFFYVAETYSELTGMHILKLTLGYSESLDLPIVLPSFAPVPIIRVTKQPERPYTATIEIEAEGADFLEYSYDDYEWTPYTGPIEDTTSGPRTIIAVSYKEGYRDNYASESYTLTPEPLTFHVEQDGSTIGMTSSMIIKPKLQYSRDGINWTAWTFIGSDTEELTLDEGENLYVIGLNEALATSMDNYSRFVMTGEIAASGNIRALLIPGAPIDSYCYFKLFYGCTALTAAPELPATDLAPYCYSEMFSGCTALTAAPELPATSLYAGCYSEMFSGCTALNSVTVGSTIWTTPCAYDWLAGVAASGTFTKPAGTDIPTGTSGIPNGWTVVNV